MNQNKWIWFVMSFFISTGIAFAQGANVASLDVVIRDFSVEHPDFENFSEEKTNIFNVGGVSTGVVGYTSDAFWMGKAATCANEKNPQFGIPIGENGYPMVTNPNFALPPYLVFNESAGPAVRYGEFSGCKFNAEHNPRSLSVLRGYVHELCPGTLKDGAACAPNSVCTQSNWFQTVYITPGMVQQNLDIPINSDGSFDYYHAKPLQSVAGMCDNDFFSQWYVNDADFNKVTLTTLELPKEPTGDYYKIDYNWNNGGYFPLDVVDPATGIWMDFLPGSDQFGPQSLSIFCPPYNYEHAAGQKDMNGYSTTKLCDSWKSNGGPRWPGAALAAANATAIENDDGQALPGTSKLRNYNFTMMGYGKFKYKSGTNEVFEFAGDDDMWIFVDGVLAVDLGGTHLAAPGKVDIGLLAANRHGCEPGQPLANEMAVNGCWTDNSWHHLHFFYADRQTDGSNLKIRSTLSEIAPTVYGQPVILSAEFIREGSSFITNMVVNTELDPNSVALIAGSTSFNFYPILATRKNTSGALDTLAYKVESFTYLGFKAAAGGHIYELKGRLCNNNECFNPEVDMSNPSNGDSLSFNFPTETTSEARNKFSYEDVNLTLFSKSNKPVGSYYWGFGKLIMSLETQLIPTDSTIDRPKFDTEKLLNEVPLDDGKLPVNATGEIIISALPEEYAIDSDINKWLENNPSYTAAPNGNGAASGHLVNGAPDATGRIAFIQSNSTAATSIGGDSESRCYVSPEGIESCTSLAFLAGQPFRINVRVFDHLGHFVSQYEETITEEAMNAILASPPLEKVGCTDNTTGVSYPAVAVGQAVINVKIYPVSQAGRKLATGPYIYQMALIELPYNHCVNFGGQQNFVGEGFKRNHFKMKRGYRRVVNK